MTRTRERPQTVKPIMCLIGAGANPELSTATLTDDLLGWSGYRDPSGRDVQFPFYASSETISDKRRPFYSWLVDQLPETSAKVGTWTFEDLIHVIEIVASEMGLPEIPHLPKPPAHRSFSSDLFIPTKLAQMLGRENAAAMVARSCVFILNRVLERSTERSSPTEASQLLARLKSECGMMLRAFTLNYEPSATSQIDTHWWRGCTPIDDEVEGFEAAIAPPDDRDLDICLHGSIHFGLRPGFTNGKTRLYRYRRTADARRAWGISTGDDYAQDGHVLVNVPMITGRRKADMLQREPFASYFSYLRHVALSTPRWLILGYSGRDPHVNHILATAASRLGSELRVVICNVIPEGDFRRLADGSVRPPGCAFLSRDRQEAAGRVFQSMEPFWPDYYQFFKDRKLSYHSFVCRGRGEKFGRVMLTIDGDYDSHFKQIAHWLR